MRSGAAAGDAGQMVSPLGTYGYLNVVESIQEQGAQFPVEFIPLDHGIESGASSEGVPVAVHRPVFKGLPVAAQSIEIDVAEEMGGLLRVRNCHAALPQLVQPVLDGRTGSWGRQTRLTRGHFIAYRIVKPPWCAVPMRGVRGIVITKLLCR